ncbi:MAG: ribokinase [Jatrophihabitans sp.]|uniref:ribokinase n=1 Tax=Jatrophihabitans sp. TaxID=1932789 RepID=UPI003F7DCEF1
MSDRSGRVVVLGSTNLDLTLRVQSLPAPGETVLGGEPGWQPGGKGGNQAVAAAAAGAAVTFLGRVGTDDAGTTLLDDLAAHRVDTSHVAKADGASGLAIVLVGPTGENQIAVAPGANQAVTPADVDGWRDVITGAAVLLVQLEVPPAAVDRAVELAAAAGCTVVLNLSPARPVEPTTLTAVDVLVVNRAEAAYSAGRVSTDEPAALAASLTAIGPRAVVVTAGGDGAFLATGDGVRHVAAAGVTAVDTTGAGDAFAGTLAARLALGAELGDAVSAAVEAGTRAVQHAGAQPPRP